VAAAAAPDSRKRRSDAIFRPLQHGTIPDDMAAAAPALAAGAEDLPAQAPAEGGRIMKGRWIVMAAAGLALGAAVPADAFAQGNSAAARERQQARQQAAGGSKAERALSAQDARRAREAAADRNRGAGNRDDDRVRDVERSREQQRADERLRAERERQREWDRQRERDRQRGRDGYGSTQRPGPSFCRDGSGHPVKGRQWCRDKGFGLGNSRAVWERARWEDIILRQPRRRDDGRLGRSVLGGIIGDRALRRFETYGYDNYGRGDVHGHWYDDADAAILELSIGGVPFARLIDSNRNGRVNTVLFRR
jgi:hypothetical protein